MSSLITVAELQEQPRTPGRIFEIAAAREVRLSLLLVTYIATGLLFMLLPGTFLGVWNLLTISSYRAAGTASPGWIQAHGHAQLFGWIRTFILGIGYYSIPKLRRVKPFALWAPWTSWGMWTMGVTLRWITGVYEWQWRALLPLSAVLEIVAFLIFFLVVSGHRSDTSPKSKLDEWILVVIAGCVGWLAALTINLLSAVFLAWRGISLVLPHGFDQRFLGLRSTRTPLLLRAVVVNTTGVLAAMVGWMKLSMLLLAAGMVLAIYSLRLFEPSDRPAKTGGVHMSFPLFVRLAYIWAVGPLCSVFG